MKQDNSDSEIERLNKIINAYEKMTALSQFELQEADKVIKAQERIQDLSRSELKELHNQIKNMETDFDYEARIKAILQEDNKNEASIMDELKAIRQDSKSTFLTDLFRVLVNHEFTPEESRQYWFKIENHMNEMSQLLRRPVGLRVALMDFFINQNRILNNPMIIEISIYDEMLKNSLQDELTGVFNRRYFDRCLKREINRAKRHNHKISLFVFDIDNFKDYNDSWGHQAGDLVLAQVGDHLLESFRTEDVVCRYGGEEFAVIMPETDGKSILKVCERFQNSLKNLNIEHGPIRISGGISVFPVDANDPVNLFMKADRLLYLAKLKGKDRIFNQVP